MRKIVVGRACAKRVLDIIGNFGIPFPAFYDWKQQLEWDINSGDVEPRIVGYGVDRFYECNVRVTYAATVYRATWDLDKEETCFNLIEFALVKTSSTAS